jgi:hypothetical protein
MDWSVGEEHQIRNLMKVRLTLQIYLRVQVRQMAEASGVEANGRFSLGHVRDHEVFLPEDGLDLLWGHLLKLGVGQDGETRLDGVGDVRGQALGVVRPSDQTLEGLESGQVHWKLGGGTGKRDGKPEVDSHETRGSNRSSPPWDQTWL